MVARDVPWGASVREGFAAARSQQQPEQWVDPLTQAEEERAEAQQLLEEVRQERELMKAEAQKIEEANAIVEAAHEELLAAQEAFERRKCGPIRVEMSTQTEDTGMNAGVQTSTDLMEPLVDERALSLAAERATAVDETFQTHGHMWLRAVTSLMQEEARSLLMLLASRLEAPAAPMAASRSSTVGVPSKLQQTWRHALHEEVRRALAPLRERIAALSPSAMCAASSGDENSRAAMVNSMNCARASAPTSAPPGGRAPHSARGFRDARSAGTPRGRHVIGPSHDERMRPASVHGAGLPPAAGAFSAAAAAAAAGSVRLDVGDRPTLPISLQGQPQSQRNAARALAWSQVEKDAARELSAMRQLFRQQQELLPLMRKRAF